MECMARYLRLSILALAIGGSAVLVSASSASRHDADFGYFHGWNGWVEDNGQFKKCNVLSPVVSFDSDDSDDLQERFFEAWNRAADSDGYEQHCRLNSSMSDQISVLRGYPTREAALQSRHDRIVRDREETDDGPVTVHLISSM